MTLKYLHLLSNGILTYSSIPIIIVGFYCWKNLSKEFKILLIGFSVYFGLIFLSNTTQWENNLFINYLASINDAIYMTLFFFLILKKKLIEKIVVVGGVFCVLLGIIDAFWITGYQNPNSISGSIETISVLSINIYCLNKLIKTHEGSLLVSALFWANMAIFLNSFPIFQQLFNRELYLYSDDLFFQVNIFTKGILTLGNIFFALAFWYAKPKTQTL